MTGAFAERGAACQGRDGSRRRGGQRLIADDGRRTMTSNTGGLILVTLMIAINCGYALAALRRARAVVAGGAFPVPDQRRARLLLAANLIVLAAAASFLAMRP